MTIAVTTARKLMLGFLPLILLLLAVSFLSLLSLDRLFGIQKSMVDTDSVLIDAMKRLEDDMIAQESYGRRFLILESDEMMTLFRGRARAFAGTLGMIRDVDSSMMENMEQLERMHREYVGMYGQLKPLEAAGERKTADAFDVRAQKLADAIFQQIADMDTAVRDRQNRGLKQSLHIVRRTFWAVAALAAAAVAVCVAAAFPIARHIATSVARLTRATQEVAAGNFTYDPRIRGRDEFSSLAEAFRSMGQRLQDLERMSLDASPLTRLPGGVSIEETLKTRVENREPVAFLMLDLDHFKAFNDKYGYARGNDVIKMAADVITAAVRVFGEESDFVGHIGGDDFAVICGPEHYPLICETIVFEFDRSIPGFYDAEDREAGHIAGKNRQGMVTVFPIMTISIAVVTNVGRLDMSHLRLSEIAAEIKDHVKKQAGSMYLADRRG